MLVRGSPGGSLPRHPISVTAIIFCALAAPFASAQAPRSSAPPTLQSSSPQELNLAPAASSTSSRDLEVPDVPGVSSEIHGFNAGLTVGGIHDSVTGWADLLTPAIGYSFNPSFSIDASVPIYLFRLAPTTDTRPRRDSLLVPQHGNFADVVLAGHFLHSIHSLDYEGTASLALPTGPAQNGLTTGRVSFDFTNRFERPFRRLSPALEIGLGDSSVLVNHINTQNYTSLGPLSHFELGLSTLLPFGASFNASVYEQLPLGDQKTYGPARNTPSHFVVTGRKIFEDNGFLDSLDIPLNRHVTSTVTYNRSLRFHADAISFGLSLILRSAHPTPPPIDEDTYIRELLR